MMRVICFVEPPRTIKGKIYGHRSSMVGDIFIIDWVRYACLSFGLD